MAKNKNMYFVFGALLVIGFLSGLFISSGMVNKSGYADRSLNLIEDKLVSIENRVETINRSSGGKESCYPLTQMNFGSPTDLILKADSYNNKTNCFELTENIQFNLTIVLDGSNGGFEFRGQNSRKTISTVMGSQPTPGIKIINSSNNDGVTVSNIKIENRSQTALLVSNNSQAVIHNFENYNSNRGILVEKNSCAQVYNSLVKHSNTGFEFNLSDVCTSSLNDSESSNNQRGILVRGSDDNKMNTMTLSKVILNNNQYIGLEYNSGPYSKLSVSNDSKISGSEIGIKLNGVTSPLLNIGLFDLMNSEVFNNNSGIVSNNCLQGNIVRSKIYGNNYGVDLTDSVCNSPGSVPSAFVLSSARVFENNVGVHMTNTNYQLNVSDTLIYNNLSHGAYLYDFGINNANNMIYVTKTTFLNNGGYGLYLNNACAFVNVDNTSFSSNTRGGLVSVSDSCASGNIVVFNSMARSNGSLPNSNVGGGFYLSDSPNLNSEIFNSSSSNNHGNWANGFTLKNVDGRNLTALSNGRNGLDLFNVKLSVGQISCFNAVSQSSARDFSIAGTENNLSGSFYYDSMNGNGQNIIQKGFCSELPPEIISVEVPVPPVPQR